MATISKRAHTVKVCRVLQPSSRNRFYKHNIATVEKVLHKTLFTVLNTVLQIIKAFALPTFHTRATLAVYWNTALCVVRNALFIKYSNFELIVVKH